jgi:hypothetical protein
MLSGARGGLGGTSGARAGIPEASAMLMGIYLPKRFRAKWYRFA